ncbi:hypothetical protein [Bartonella sp. HY406]|uniref:hypothetical protein n=1 Tax=Bartonella sp. HY406 TaxID=2979331 RepID=UPI0021CA8C36|nr:hypothetical protein [Bartonella sp. HY406]UXN03241.1 hypothetical protein N6B01_12375 [Bartonella sp. HY406]
MWNYIADIENLKNFQSEINDETFQYITDLGFYDPDSHTSLHDAWLVSLNMIYGNTKDLLQRKFEPVNLQLCFLGAYHDQIIDIFYEDVLQYKIEGNGDLSDLLTHKFAWHDDHLCHELCFATGKLVIEFKNVRFKVSSVEENF